jgi:hypothetical protein
MQLMPYSIERLSYASLHDLQALHRLTYSRNVSISRLAGKYNTKLLGAEWLGHFAFAAQHQPVAFFGVIPCRFQIDGQMFLAGQAVDAMTHPDHRKNGLFLQLVEKTLELARHQGIQFIFGFPNQNSYAGLVKANWKFTGRSMHVFILKGSKLPWAKLLLKVPFVRNVYRKLTEGDSAPPNETVVYSSEHGLIRDSVFFAYKDQYTKTFVKRWSNVSAWLKNDGALKIGCLNFDPIVSPQDIEKHLKREAKRLGCRSIVLMTSAESRLYGALKNLVPPRERLPIGFYNLTNRDIDFNKATFEYCDIDIF